MNKSFTLYLVMSVLLVSTGISGCQKNVDYKAKMDAAKDCCQSYADLTYQKLVYDEPINQEIGDDEQVMAFPEGKSFYMAVQLPTYKSPFEIQIDSTPLDNKLFVPSLILLNDRFEVTKQINDSVFEYSNGNSSYNFFINEEDRTSRYMIVYTRSDIVGKKHASVTTQQSVIPIYAAGFMLVYTDHDEVNNTIINARGGKINILAKEYKLRSIHVDNTASDSDS